MKLRMYCTFDSATQVFSPPMFFVAEGQARRLYQDEVNRKASDNQIANHPEYFSFFYVGDYDDQTGLCTPVAAPELMASAVSLVIPVQ